MRIRIWLALLVVSGLLGVVTIASAPAGAAVVRAQVPPMSEAAPADAAAAIESAAPAISDIRFASPIRSEVVVDMAGLRQQLDAGSFTLPLPQGGSAVITGGSFTGVVGVEESDHWAVTTPAESITSLTLTEFGLYGFATVDGRRLDIVPMANGVHLVYEDGRTRDNEELAEPVVPFTPVGEPPQEIDYQYDSGGPALSLANLSLESRFTAAMLQGPVASVRILVLVDQNVITAWGGSGPALAQAAASINATNAVFSGSGTLVQIDPRIREINYTSTGTGNLALNRLRSPFDSYYDQAHLMREAHDADLVMMFSDLWDVCGIANIPQGPVSIVSDMTAFSVIAYDCIGPRYVIAHEMGHNLGSLHDPVNATSNAIPALPYSYGWPDPVNDFRTIMSYGNSLNGCTTCDRIPQFSSNVDTWMGFPTGDATHNNKQSINNMADNAAAYRPDTCPSLPHDFVNDGFALGTVPSASASASSVCATSEAYEGSYVYQRPANSLWYSWTAPASVPTRVTTCQPDTAIDTVLNVWSGTSDGTPDPLNFVATSDNDFTCPYSWTHSTVNFTAIAGLEYHFQLDGYGALRGMMGLLVTQQECNGVFPTLYGSDVTGTAVNEVILGTSGPDTLTAGGGDDVVCGGNGVDKIYLGAGNDTAYGSAGSDSIYGGTGNDILEGGDGVDKLFGQAGADTLRGDSGNDRMYGGADNDELRGGSGDDRLYGQAGVDTIFGEAGDDVIAAGVGNDVVRAGGGDDTVWGQAGDDELWGYTGADTIYGSADDDTIHGEDDADWLHGQGGNDVLTGDQGADTMYGGGGADNLSGGSQNDTMYGQAGNDSLTGDAGTNDYCHGGEGSDSATCETEISVP